MRIWSHTDLLWVTHHQRFAQIIVLPTIKSFECRKRKWHQLHSPRVHILLIKRYVNILTNDKERQDFLTEGPIDSKSSLVHVMVWVSAKSFTWASFHEVLRCHIAPPLIAKFMGPTVIFAFALNKRKHTAIIFSVTYMYWSIDYQYHVFVFTYILCTILFS